ncbi:rhodanese-like domain-containing protein [Limnobacter sp.]|uniref:rhodanese-like domain-containing protein n=1 Tax=Limnobacter sp. TaxID=2003368 RepID=UPI002FE1DCF6
MAPTPTAPKLIEIAKQRAQEKGLNYLGALTPEEAWNLLNEDENAVLVDVRTDAELDWVGHVSFSEDRSFHVEWNNYPDGMRTPDFLAQIASRVEPHQPVLFICRSGARSHHAATLAAKHGFEFAINVLEGFEGDKNENHQRSSINGWRFRGLPWEQH